MKEIIEHHLERLKSEPFSELSKLGPCESRRIKSSGRDIILTTWKEMVDENEVKIVVQVYNPLLLGVGKMRAQGFTKTSLNRLRDLRAEELYEFT